jgi:5-methyltetrahydropteroyltriglutamate--homocysteine methyltransferase
MKRSDQRILTTHTGSLPRPAALLESADGSAHDALLRTSVADVVQQQVAVGLDIVNDGEFGKSSWAAYVLERISGFEIRRDELIPLHWLGRDRERFPEFFAQEMPGALKGSPTEVCTGPIAYQGQAFIRRDLDNLKAALPSGAEGFFTAVAPASTGYNARNEYYSSDREYVYAIADALKQEYHAIIDAGLLLQVDDAVLANMYDYLVQQSPERYREWAQLRVEALNHALDGVPEDRVRYHVCFGSWHVPHVADAPLEDIVDLILQVRAGAYSIEAANPRHEHEWQDADSGHRHAPPDHGGAPAHRGRQDHPFRAAGGQGERHRWHRLRLCPGPGHPARAPQRHVGQVRVAGGRRTAGVSRIVELNRSRNRCLAASIGMD